MSFKLKVTGLKELDRATQALARQISPQIGIADALEDGAWIIALEARDNATMQGLIESGELIDSIKPRKINQYRVDVVVGVPYGAAHEFGVTVTITPKQRRFFWAMYKRTEAGLWKALALSITYTIPARPYLRPAIDSHKPYVYEAVGKKVVENLKLSIQRAK